MRVVSTMLVGMALLLSGGMAMANNGLVTVPSNHSLRETVDLLRASLTKDGVTIFAQIDHAAGAREVNLQLLPTVLLVFGDPKAGTPLMVSERTIGIDLPLKALTWEDSAGKVWVSYSDPVWLGERHGLPSDQFDRLKAMAASLDRLFKVVAAP